MNSFDLGETIRNNDATTSIVGNFYSITENYKSTQTSTKTISRSNTITIHQHGATADTSYNPYDFGKLKNHTSFHGTVLHLLILSAGPAILTVPPIFYGVGNIIGVLGTILMIGLYNHCCHLFLRVEYYHCKQKKIPKMTFSETVYSSFLEGPYYLKITASTARFITYLVFIIPWLGGNSLNLLLIAENLELVSKLLWNYDMDIRTVMLYTFIPLLLLCWIPSLNYLVPISFFGNVLNILVIFVIIYHAVFDPFYPQKQTTNFNIIDLSLLLGSVLFCVNCTPILTPLKNDMKNPQKFSSNFGVLNISNFSIAIIYAGFNLLCCLKYGKTLLDNVVMNLPQDQYSTKIAILMFVMAVCFQFPLISYVVFDLFWNVLLKEKKAKLNNLLLWEYVVRSLVVVGAYVMAIAIPSIKLFITITGTLASPVDAFVFPCIIDQVMRYTEQKCVFKPDFIFVKNVVIGCIGIALMISGVISCTNQIVN